jgi:hypothetical protein
VIPAIQQAWQTEAAYLCSEYSPYSNFS